MDVTHVGLPILFVLIAVESMGVPLPGETALFAAAILASKGKFSIEAVIAIAATAAILGDNVGYLIGRKFGRRLLEAPGPFERHRRAVITYGQPFFDKHGPKAVFLGRFVSGLRITAAWLAGVNRMRWRDFLFWNATGGIVWATAVGDPRLQLRARRGAGDQDGGPRRADRRSGADARGVGDRAPPPRAAGRGRGRPRRRSRGCPRRGTRRLGLDLEDPVPGVAQDVELV